MLRVNLSVFKNERGEWYYMKKVFALLLIMTLACQVISCDYNAPLRNKMLNYYSNNDNYYELKGTIISNNSNEKTNVIENSYFLQIDILGECEGFSKNGDTGLYEFVVIIPRNEFMLFEGDVIDFISAPMYFYNGHILPVVSVTRDEEILLDFEEGKVLYQEWIRSYFR